MYLNTSRIQWELLLRSFIAYCPIDMCRQGSIVSLGNRLSILSGGGEVVRQWCEEVTYVSQDTPCPPKELVSPMTTKVGNYPNNREIAKQNSYSTDQKVATVHTCVTHRTTSHCTTSLLGKSHDPHSYIPPSCRKC